MWLPLPYSFACACPSLRRENTSPRDVITLPHSDTTQSPSFELCIAMATALHEHQHHCPQSPVLRWMAAKQIIGNFFLSQEGRELQIEFRLFGGYVCQGHLASVSMRRQIKVWFRALVREGRAACLGSSESSSRSSLMWRRHWKLRNSCPIQTQGCA